MTPVQIERLFGMERNQSSWLARLMARIPRRPETADPRVPFQD